MAEMQKIHGIHAVQALIKARPDHIVNAWMDRQRKDAKLQAIKQSLDEVGIRVDYVDKKTLEKLSSNANHQGVLLTAKLPQERTEEQLKKALKEQQDQAFYLVLDQVTDPHNLFKNSVGRRGARGYCAKR